jgi:hypothetical protein
MKIVIQVDLSLRADNWQINLPVALPSLLWQCTWSHKSPAVHCILFVSD